MNADSFEEDDDEYNADSPEHEKKLLRPGKGNMEYAALQEQPRTLGK